MSIISVELMKKMDETEMQKAAKQKEIKTERSKGNRSSGERVRAKWFYCAFKLGFLQLICKASLIFKSNLALALSIILKQRQLYESTHVAVEYRCSKIWEFLSFLICSSILVLIWWQVSPIYLELHRAQVNLYTRKDFKSLEIGSLYEKWFSILNELKTSLILTFSLQSFESFILIWSDLSFHWFWLLEHL